jgi:hypothetical protein
MSWNSGNQIEAAPFSQPVPAMSLGARVLQTCYRADQGGSKAMVNPYGSISIFPGNRNARSVSIFVGDQKNAALATMRISWA